MSAAATPNSAATLGQRWAAAIRRFTFRVSTSIQGALYRTLFRFEQFLVYVYEACLDTTRRALKAIRNSRIVKAIISLTRWLTVLVAMLFLLFVIIRETVFIIDFDFDGVITRFGAYHRTVNPGFNFKIPLVEKLYVVNTEDRRQEHFGFLQMSPPLKPMTDAEKERYEDEQELIDEQSIDELNAQGTGSFMRENQRGGPRLTLDYVIETQLDAPEPVPQDQQEDEVRERLKQRIESAELIVPPSGKVPIPEEMKMIAGDLNLVYLTYTVQYEIIVPHLYLFNAIDVRRNIRDLAQVAIRIAVGDRSSETVLSASRAEIETETKNYLQTIVDRYNLGLDITSVIIQDANPPDQVKVAFHEVNAAKQEMENLVHLAESEYNSTVPQMHGKADRAIAEAKAYKTHLLEKARGEADRFSNILTEYRRAPEVVRTRYYLEALEELHQSVNITLIDPELRGILPVFGADKNSVEGGIAHGVLQTNQQSHSNAAATSTDPALAEGQHAVTATSLSNFGPTELPNRNIDPPRPVLDSAARETAPPGASRIGEQSAATIIKPANVAPIDPRP